MSHMFTTVVKRVNKLEFQNIYEQKKTDLTWQKTKNEKIQLEK